MPDATNSASTEGNQGEIIEDILSFLRYDGNQLGDKNGQAIAQQIASNGRKFIEQHLTLKEVESYWYELLSTYSKLMDFQPSLNKQYINIVK